MDLTCFALHHKTEYRADFNFFFRNAYNRNSLVDIIISLFHFVQIIRNCDIGIDNYQRFFSKAYPSNIFADFL
jgi:hypothetical protein